MVHGDLSGILGSVVFSHFSGSGFELRDFHSSSPSPPRLFLVRVSIFGDMIEDSWSRLVPARSGRFTANDSR